MSNETFQGNMGPHGVYPVDSSQRRQVTFYIFVKMQTINKKFSELNENLIYGNIKEQLMIVSIYSEVLQVRESLKEVISPQVEGPVYLVDY